MASYNTVLLDILHVASNQAHSAAMEAATKGNPANFADVYRDVYEKVFEKIANMMAAEFGIELINCEEE